MAVKRGNEKKLQDFGVPNTFAHALANDRKWDDVKVPRVQDIAKFLETDSETAERVHAQIHAVDRKASDGEDDGGGPTVKVLLRKSRSRTVETEWPQEILNQRPPQVPLGRSPSVEESNEFDEEDRVPHRLHLRTPGGGWFAGGASKFVQLFHLYPSHRLESELNLSVHHLDCGRRLISREDALRCLPEGELPTLPGLERLAPSATEYISRSCWQDNDLAESRHLQLMELFEIGLTEDVRERRLQWFEPAPDEPFRRLRYLRNRPLQGSGFPNQPAETMHPVVHLNQIPVTFIRITTEWTNPRPISNSNFTDRFAILRRATGKWPAAVFEVFNTEMTGIEHLPPFLRSFAHGLVRNREFKWVRYQHLNHVARAFAVLHDLQCDPEFFVSTMERTWWRYFLPAQGGGSTPLENIAAVDEELSKNIKNEIFRKHWLMPRED